MRDYGFSWSELNSSESSILQDQLIVEIRQNRYDEESGVLTISDDRAEAIFALSTYYSAIFGDASTFPTNLEFLADNGMTPDELREAYAMPNNTLKSQEDREKLAAFFFWTSWTAITERDNSVDMDHQTLSPTISYTNNWPADPLVGNQPSGTLVIWSIVSVVLLLAGIAVIVYIYISQKELEEEIKTQSKPEQIFPSEITPSMRATEKYFWVVTGLFLFQIPLGAMTAHYGVEGQNFYGIPTADILPYSIVRTWHVQLALFWIATSWLAAGLYFAPAISGHEPKHQRLFVNILFGAILFVALGSIFGEWLGIRGTFGLKSNFFLGHQGYEYLDLGRFWQILLFLGLVIWFILIFRALRPALKENNQQRDLVILFVLTSASIALFYGAGLMYGSQTNLAITEYWRWWVVHLWVEGFFEVFATVVIGLLLSKLGLISIRSATLAIIFSAILFLFGGILGMFHHLYFTGTPTIILALGATFSALEVVPLVLVGFEAQRNLGLLDMSGNLIKYKLPTYFLISVSFWNLLGAGLFGFLINPPIALYYMQGLNTTPVHGHAALFGVYGMLGIGLMLYSLVGLGGDMEWKTKYLTTAFWLLNIGLLFMIVFSMLPIGILQTIASVKYGMWYARSAEFMQSSTLDNLRWLRIIGDTIFAIGALALAWFILGLKTGWSYINEEKIGDTE